MEEHLVVFFGQIQGMITIVDPSPPPWFFNDGPVDTVLLMYRDNIPSLLPMILTTVILQNLGGIFSVCVLNTSNLVFNTPDVL